MSEYKSDYKGHLTINEVVDRIEWGASKPSGDSIHFFTEDLITLRDYISKFTKSAGSLIYIGNDPQPTHAVKLETDDLVEIKAMVDNGATLVIERGGGLNGLTLRGGGFSYIIESTSGLSESCIEFANAYSFFKSGFTKGRQIYVDYPILPTTGKASAKSKAREELDQAESLWGEMPTGYTSNCIRHIMSAVDALIEGAE